MPAYWNVRGRPCQTDTNPSVSEVPMLVFVSSLSCAHVCEFTMIISTSNTSMKRGGGRDSRIGKAQCNSIDQGSGGVLLTVPQAPVECLHQGLRE